MKQFLFTLWFCTLVWPAVKAQTTERFVPDTTTRIVYGKYLKATTGLTFASLRDRGNSALYYRGLLTATTTSFYMSSDLREFEIAIGAVRGNLFAESKSGAHAQAYSAVSLSAAQLYTVYRRNKLHIKAGAGLHSQINTRVNPELFNTYTTVENFSSLNLIGNLDYYFAIFRYNRPDRIFKLSYRLTGSVLPLAFRPGYAYVDNIVVNNPDYLSDHKLRITGYNITSEISLTRFLPNKNAIAISYRWNGLTAGHNQFELATHSLALGFLFNYK
jgi:hypothetical protein